MELILMQLIFICARMESLIVYSKINLTQSNVFNRLTMTVKYIQSDNGSLELGLMKNYGFNLNSILLLCTLAVMKTKRHNTSNENKLITLNNVFQHVCGEKICYALLGIVCVGYIAVHVLYKQVVC